MGQTVGTHPEQDLECKEHKVRVSYYYIIIIITTIALVKVLIENAWHTQNRVRFNKGRFKWIFQDKYTGDGPTPRN